MTPTICRRSMRPVSECPFEERSVTPSEWEPSLEHVTPICSKCGEWASATRERAQNQPAS
ncbi:hypothetical protein [Pseudomonas boanensis]|uniref:hypothetical protein n=1 Tax=Metapseudomonas boanensis TaxID=2822138 RepID=UPI0035D464A4